MGELTEFERKTLEILQRIGKAKYTSQVGYLLFADAAPNRKANPSAQGMALAAGRFLGKLQRRGLISGYEGWSITAEGVAALEKEQAALQTLKDMKNAS